MSTLTLQTLVPGDWNIFKMFDNATNLGTKLGGSLLVLVGLVCIVCAVIFVAQKLLSEQSRRSWVTIILLTIFGGAMMAGGITMFINLAKGSQSTINDLGNGLILLQLLR